MRQEVERVCKIPPEMIKKVKDDHLASEEFQEEKFEYAMDEHSRGFNEYIHQIRKLDPSFNVTRLKEDLSEKEEGEERENVGK